MYQKIVEETLSFSDPSFAEWIKPYLNIKDDLEDLVVGIRVPILRKLAKKYKNIDLDILKKLLNNKIHEIRALAIFIMLIKSKKISNDMCKMYLENLDFINNWDLIDYSAPYIVAPFVSKNKLIELSKESNLWANRIAIVSTIYYIRQYDFDLTLRIAKEFINHKHHLIHKATGWMLREVGKRDINTLLCFLSENEKIMPSIMRSYACEKIRNIV